MARIVAFSDAAVNPVDWPIAPAKGIQELLIRAGSVLNVFLVFVVENEFLKSVFQC